MTDSNDLSLILGEPEALEQRLVDDIARIQATQPLGRITVLVDNTMLAPYLRQRLAGNGRGYMNLEIITPAKLAEKLAVGNLASNGKRPMPKLGDRVLSRRIAETTSTSYFGQVAYSPGFADTLRRLIRELTQAGMQTGQFRAAIERLSGDGTAKLHDIAELYAHYEREQAKFYTAEDSFHQIVWGEGDRLKEKIGPVVLCYGIWRLTGNQRSLIRQLRDNGIRVSLFLPQTGTDADLAHDELRAWLEREKAVVEELSPSNREGGSLDYLKANLFLPVDGPAPEDGQVRLLSAPDPPREVREAARTCLKWSKELGIPFHRMAVVYRHGDPYRTLIDQIFRQAGISVYLHSGRPLIEQPVGRRLVALLNLIGADMPRASMMEFITETVLPKTTSDEFDDETLGSIQPARWDQISREAGIVEGRDQWLARLELLRTSKAEFVQPDDEDQDDRLRRELQEIDRLHRFIQRISADLTLSSDRQRWSVHLGNLKQVSGRYVDGIDDVLERLATLENLDELDHEVSFERFRETVRFWLAQQNSYRGANSNSSGDEPGTETDHEFEPEAGRIFRRGVNVFDVGSLRHVCADAVIILGVAERQFPSPPRQDPLLLDRERSALNDVNGWALPLRALGADEEALTFAMAVNAATTRLQISYPRSEAGGSRSYLPSHFFRAAVAALTGQEVEAGKIDRVSSAFFTRVPSGRFGSPDDGIPLDDHEYDRVLLETDQELGLKLVTEHRESVERARRANNARRRGELSEYDGWIGRDLAASVAWTAGKRGRAISPSRLETFATCPYQFFLKYVLRLEMVEEPELLDRIGALERGSLVHEILERFLTALSEHGEVPAEAKRAEHLGRLYEIADETCKDLEDKGLVGYRVLWQYERIAIYEDLEEWYDREAQDLAGHALRPETFELRFGWARTPGEGGKHSRDEPFTLNVEREEPFRFQGRVDRVDISPDGSRFRVIDYKTGKSGYYKANTLNGGRSLQLPIYLRATSDLLGIPWEPSEAQYFFPTRRGEFKRVPFEGAWLREHESEFVDLLQGISQAIAEGLFPQITGNDNAPNCNICDFTDICPASVKRISKRKQADENVFWLRQVIEAEG